LLHQTYLFAIEDCPDQDLAKAEKKREKVQAEKEREAGKAQAEQDREAEKAKAERGREAPSQDKKK